MKRQIFIKNTPINEKRISRIETVISRMSGRLHKVTTSIIAPQVISHCVFGDDVSGDIAKFMLFRGTVKKCMMCFDRLYKDPIVVRAEIFNGDEAVTKTLNAYRRDNVLNVDVPTIDGTRVSVSIENTNPEVKIKEVWFSLLWIPHISITEVETRMIDNLLETAESNLVE